MHCQTYICQIGMVALGMAGLIIYSGFYRAKLASHCFVMRGFIGYASFLGGSILGVLGFDLQLLRTLSGGFWEISIGAGLTSKGVNSPACVSEFAKDKVI